MTVQRGRMNERGENFVVPGAGELTLAAAPGALSQLQDRVGRIVAVRHSLLLHADEVIR